MPALEDSRHELFCQHRARGLSRDAAYAACGYAKNASNAARLNRNDHIKARIQELMDGNASDIRMSVDAIHDWLEGAIVQPGDSVTGSEMWCQEVTITETGTGKNKKVSRKYKMVEKKGCLDMLCRLRGLYPKDQAEVAINLPLDELLRRLRRPGIPRVPQ